MSTHWPPPFQVRLSQRAKRILVSIHATRGLEVGRLQQAVRRSIRALQRGLNPLALHPALDGAMHRLGQGGYFVGEGGCAPLLGLFCSHGSRFGFLGTARGRSGIAL